jgi:hypothetical protein
MIKSKKFTASKRGTSKFIPAAFGLLTILLVHYSPPARAGWSVNVGASGQGTVTVKVSNTCETKAIKTPFMYYPSATINQQSNNLVFATNGVLPACASSQTYVQVQATNNYKTSIQSQTGPGDQNDNDDLLQFIIPKSACASGNVEVIPLLITNNSVTFRYIAKLSDEGSAVLLRVVDSQTGQQRYVVLLTGPFDNTTNDCEGTFTVIGDTNKLVLLVDGNSSTLPFNITCPGDMVLGCNAAALTTYDPPAVATGDTGPFTVTYNPLPSQLVFGVTNLVTATATDTNGCSVSCQFKVYRQPISFDGFYSPISGADATGGSCQTALRTFKLGNVVPVKFQMSCGGQPVTSGVPIILIQDCTGGISYQGPFQLVNDEWHFNIDSTIIGAAGKYTITAVLPDGSQHSVVLQFKR